MSFSRRLDRDEQAELDAKPGVYTQDEMRLFDVHCARLFALGDMSGVESTGSATVHRCPTGCGRRVPAGIPLGWHRSKYDMCPACCMARHTVAVLSTDKPGALDLALNEYVVDEEADKRAFFNAIKKIGAR
jgi:hypothetical protein